MPLVFVGFTMLHCLLPLGSAASGDQHELGPHKGLGVVQRRPRQWFGRFYPTDNAEHEEAVTLQHGDFKAAGCPLIRAGKMNAREANGLVLVRNIKATVELGHRVIC